MSKQYDTEKVASEAIQIDPGVKQLAAYRPPESNITNSMTVEQLATALDQLQVRQDFELRRQISDCGQRIRDARAASGLSQEELAAAAGVSRATLASVESGSTPGGPRLKTIIRLFEACGKSLTFVLNDREPGSIMVRGRVVGSGGQNVVGYTRPAGPIPNTSPVEGSRLRSDEHRGPAGHASGNDGQAPLSVGSSDARRPKPSRHERNDPVYRPSGSS